MAKNTLAIQNKSLTRFARDVATLAAKAHAFGLHETGHALHEAVRKVGWEIEAIILKDTPQ